MKSRFSIFSAALTLIVLSILPIALAQPAQNKVVAGKVVNVTHEKVNVNQAWLDKITVTVDDCLAPGKMSTVVYSPATVSDRTVLGHLFDQTIHSAYTMDNIQQQMSNGYGVFWVDQNNVVKRTGILGHNIDCRVMPEIVKQF